ncbi:MAG: hypothetical protein ACKOET_17700, partial [Verrucomicrobiota bacterium]
MNTHPSRFQKTPAWQCRPTTILAALLLGLFLRVQSAPTPNHLHQLHSGTTNSPAHWDNGDINNNNSCYSEGDSVPFRYLVGNLVPGETYRFTINIHSYHNGIHYFDSLTSYDASEASRLALVGPCGPDLPASITDCATPTGMVSFPNPSLAASYDPPLPALFSPVP